ncbi:ribosome maturation factor RimM [Mangrovibrevibacter kandeliae]|uniref:ribosome maturation factor RimM n=1 Tax=Mangrovibrevibacter kandeliae TaxID=2968473 RepID=UPI0021196333|nr:ribosome maturation factor RimM [Aurantimonas sp. CSK15Z-1]MCQ8783689.1 ribosome maturation factor RimM [Aurantimonas sp. CSK15Z-1]
MSLEHPVLLGVVGGAHGIRGEVRVNAFTANPADLGAYGPLQDAQGNRFTVASARPQKTVVVVRFEEVRDRNAAERLNGRELFVDRSVLPPEDEDEFYQADLIGMAVETVAGEPVGTVVAFHDFGAGDLVEIAPERGPTVMIPFSEAAVPEIDDARGVLIVEPVAAGLAAADADEGEDEGEGEGAPDDDDTAGPGGASVNEEEDPS